MPDENKIVGFWGKPQGLLPPDGIPFCFGCADIRFGGWKYNLNPILASDGGPFGEELCYDCDELIA